MPAPLNASELNVDLGSITDLVLTHNHGDHTGGLLTLRNELMKRNPVALSRRHVPKGIFVGGKTVYRRADFTLP